MRCAAAGLTVTPWSPDWLDEISHALAVLQDLHTIAVEPAHDRTRGRGPKAPRGDARLILERGAERHLELLGQILSRQHRRRLDTRRTGCACRP